MIDRDEFSEQSLSIEVAVPFLIKLMLIFDITIVFIQITVSVFRVYFLILFFFLFEKLLIDWHFVPVDGFQVLQVYFVSLSQLFYFL